MQNYVWCRDSNNTMCSKIPWLHQVSYSTQQLTTWPIKGNLGINPTIIFHLSFESPIPLYVRRVKYMKKKNMNHELLEVQPCESHILSKA